MLTPVTTTSVYAVLLAFVFLGLSVRAMAGRRQARVSFGEGNSEDLRRRLRAHANFAEYTPLALILMGLLELQGAGGFVLNVIGLLLLVGRVSHAYGLSRIPEHLLARSIGMGLTMASMVFSCLALLSIALFG
ncbi:MAG TPA: MAPEG family protein [Terriglobia bacterium]|nr:MAPEG family protein [Terriglobia bacterium]